MMKREVFLLIFISQYIAANTANSWQYKLPNDMSLNDWYTIGRPVRSQPEVPPENFYDMDDYNSEGDVFLAARGKRVRIWKLDTHKARSGSKGKANMKPKPRVEGISRLLKNYRRPNTKDAMKKNLIRMTKNLIFMLNNFVNTKL